MFFSLVLQLKCNKLFKVKGTVTIYLFFPLSLTCTKHFKNSNITGLFCVFDVEYLNKFDRTL